MDLVSWYLKAIDQIFLTRRLDKGEPACPDGTFAARYTMDSWEKCRALCPLVLSIEDVEGAYITGLMVTGFLLFGASGFLMYRKIQKMLAAILTIVRLSDLCEGLCCAFNILTQALCEQNCRLVVVPGSFA